MRHKAPLLALAAQRGYDERPARECLRHFAQLYGVDEQSLTADFCGADFLQALDEAAGEEACAPLPPPKRPRLAADGAGASAGAADDEEVICLDSSSDDDAADEPVAPKARVQPSITAFFSTQGALPAPGARALPPAATRRHANGGGSAAPLFGVEDVTDAGAADDAADDADLDALDDLALANRVCFGNTSFRPQQRRICEAVLAGRDTFVLMPTGGGKSLCYQLPAVLSPGVTVVCSPLLSLIQDQVSALVRGDAARATGGVPASYLSSQQSAGEYAAVLAELRKAQPTLKLLYVTPEQLVNGGGLNATLAALNAAGQLARFVIDEAHCVSTWGHAFRADYKALGCLRERYPRVPIVALTATATERVRADTLKLLRMHAPPRLAQFCVSFNRPNLTFAVRPKVGGAAGLAAFAAHVARAHGGHESGIVYCLSRDECSTVCDALAAAGVSSVIYHAGLTPKQRAEAQRAWGRGAARVACATVAFGMGIDKADVRFVLHWSMPKSLEGLYQEAGRAGRDGAPATHTLFFSAADHARVTRLIKRGKRGGGGGGGSSIATQLRLADAVRDFCVDKNTCRRVAMLKYLGEAFSADRCGGTCDNCLRRLGRLPPGHDEPLPGAGAPQERPKTAGRKGKRKRKAAQGGVKGARRAKGAQPSHRRAAAAGGDDAPSHGGGSAFPRASTKGARQAAAALAGR